MLAAGIGSHNNTSRYLKVGTKRTDYLRRSKATLLVLEKQSCPKIVR